MPAVSTFKTTGNPHLDALLKGTKWSVDTLTFSFPTDASFYGPFYGSEPTNNFGAFSKVQQAAMRDVLEQYSSVANLTFVEITETSTQHADLRYAESNAPGTAWAYGPSTSAIGGDAWFNKSTSWYDNPIKGNYGYLTYLHEVGHTLGLKHPHTASGSFGAMPLAQDSMEFTVMSYRSYVGAGTGGFTNEGWGYAQSLMMNDIAAIQHLYGADYTTNAGNTVYRWSATTGEMFVDGVGQDASGANRIFLTVWDGGGSDTYDFSNYSTNLKVDLQPGGWTTTSSSQLAYLGGGIYARGNIANALLHDNNQASLIENAKGGSGSDSLVGNSVANTLWGNGGDDTLSGLGGNDALVGGAGDDFLDGGSGVDVAYYLGRSDQFCWCENADGTYIILDLRDFSSEGMDTLANIEFLQFSDQWIALSTGGTGPSNYGTQLATSEGIPIYASLEYDDHDEAEAHDLPLPISDGTYVDDPVFAFLFNPAQPTHEVL